MKKLSLFAVAGSARSPVKMLLAMVLMLLIPAPVELNAQSKQNKTVNAEFSVFWVKFKTALVKNDKEQIAAMTKFPFPYQGYGDHDLSITEFIKQYDRIFNLATRLCFSKKKTIPIANSDFYHGYSVFCGASIYSFEKVQGEYKFSDKHPDD